MSKTPPGPPPDPLARDVDRLLKQLAQVGTQPERHRGAKPGGAPAARPASRQTPRPTSVPVPPPVQAPSRRDLLALWARVLLVIVLGGVMTQWPYPRGCGLPLLGYLCAVATVILAGGWIAIASWKLRSAPAHVVSLILVYWGVVLAAEQVLPRLGYAAERATWRCPAIALPGAAKKLRLSHLDV